MPIKRPDLVLDETGAFGYSIAFRRYLVALTATTDLVTLNSHGFSEGWPAYIPTSSNGITGGVELYIRNVTTNTFQLSLSQSGSIIDITSDSTSFQLFVILPLSNVEINTFLGVANNTSLSGMFTTAQALKFDKSFVGFASRNFEERTNLNKTSAPFVMSEFFNYGNFGQLRGETGISGQYGYTFNRHYVFSTVGGIDYKVNSIDAQVVTNNGPQEVSNFLKTDTVGTNNNVTYGATLTSGSSLIQLPTANLAVNDRLVFSSSSFGGFSNAEDYYITGIVDANNIRVANEPGGINITATDTGAVNFLWTHTVRINPRDGDVTSTPVPTTLVSASYARQTRFFKWRFESSTNANDYFIAQEYINDAVYFRGQFNLGIFNNNSLSGGVVIPGANIAATENFVAVRLDDLAAPKKLYFFVLPNTGVTDEETTGFEARCTITRIDNTVVGNVGPSNLVTVAGHGLTNGDKVLVRSSGISSLNEGVFYYALVVDVDTFRLEATIGGGAATITDGAELGLSFYVIVQTFNSERALLGGTGAKPLRRPAAGYTVGGVAHTYTSSVFDQVLTFDSVSNIRLFNGTYVLDTTSGNYYYVINANDSTFQLSLTKGGAAVTFAGSGVVNLEAKYHDSNTILIYRHNNYLPTMLQVTIDTDYWYEIYLETKKSALGTFPETITNTNSTTSFYVYI